MSFPSSNRFENQETVGHRERPIVRTVVYSHANNRNDMPCRFLVRMLYVEGRPKITVVDGQRRAARAHPLVAADIPEHRGME